MRIAYTVLVVIEDDPYADPGTHPDRRRSELAGQLRLAAHAVTHEGLPAPGAVTCLEHEESVAAYLTAVEL